jgi:hypothetical protein
MVLREGAVAPGEGQTTLAAKLDDAALAREADVLESQARHRKPIANREITGSERPILPIYSHLSVSLNYQDFDASSALTPTCRPPASREARPSAAAGAEVMRG